MGATAVADVISYLLKASDKGHVDFLADVFGIVVRGDMSSLFFSL
jgi:hypothetical protein